MHARCAPARIALRRSNRALAAAHDAVRRRSEELERASHRIKRLEGLLPICAACKSIRDEEGCWHALENYVTDNSEASFTHGLCPGCADRSITQAGLAPLGVD